MTPGRGWIAVLLLSTTAVPAAAGCPYFLTHSKMERCKVVPPGTTASGYNFDSGDGLLQDTNTKEGPSVQVVCACDYTLKGAAAISPQCDLDRTDEPSFILPAFDEKVPCSDRRKPCEDLCPKELSD